MFRLAVVADNRSDDWCYRLAARFADVAIEKFVENLSGTVSDSAEAIAEQLSRFDAVWVSSSKHSSQISPVAAQAGKHLIVDSRVALSAANLDTLQDAVAAGGAQCVIASSLRYLPGIQVVKEQLDSGNLGEPGLLRIHHWHAWEHDRDSSAKSLPAELSDQIDLGCWLFDGMPTHVYARRQSLDYVQLHLGFPNGGMALIDAWRSKQTGPGYFSLSLIGSSGAAYADDHHNMQLMFHDGPITALRTEQEHLAAKNQIEDLLAAVQEQREANRSFDRARQLLNVVAAVQESLENDQAVAMEKRES